MWGDKVEKFKGQNYFSLRRKFMSSKELFSDPLFPPNDSSLNMTTRSLHGRVVWKRPSEICNSPKLFVDKANSKDVTQGKLGNCWFVAAAASLATVKALWSQVVPDYQYQEWDPVRPEMYTGIFHFRFWRFGKWVDVVIDDLLPTINDNLIFCHSTTQNEFWSALLEKAYAKLCGSYGALDGGNLSDALVDFTSGLSEIINLREGYDEETKKNLLRKMLLREHEEHSLMCCAIPTSDSAMFESRTRTGLVLGHAYGITSVKEISVGSNGLFSIFKSGDKITLIRLRNPWGHKEWNGPFSDGGDSHPGHSGDGDGKSDGESPSSASSSKDLGASFAFTSTQLLNVNSRSPEWTKISRGEKERLGLTFEDDGEFWMPFDDFISEFTQLSICRLINTSFFTFRQTWNENVLSGEWTLPNKAGGCLNNDSFLKNPQFCFTVTKKDMEIKVQLMQPDLRGRWTKNTSGVDYKSIGFHMMKVEENRKYRVNRLKPRAATSDYIRNRAVFFQGTLDKGKYVIVPTTFDPNIELEFLLRIYTEEPLRVFELTKDFPEPHFLCSCCSSSPSAVTLLNVEKATGLAKSDIYCVIRAEKDTLVSRVVHQTDTPEWGLKGMFFRYDICKPIFIEIWEKKLIKDQFLGSAVVSGSADNQLLSVKSPLVGRGSQASERKPGELHFTIVTYDELTSA